MGGWNVSRKKLPEARTGKGVAVGAAQSSDSIYMLPSLPELGRQTLTLGMAEVVAHFLLETSSKQDTARMEPS